MSYLLEVLGRGLVADLEAVFARCWSGLPEDDADDLFERCAAIPTSLDLALRCGAACLREARLRDAEAAFARAQQLAPESSKPLLGLACVADALGRVRPALEQLGTARDLDQYDPAITFGIAFCHERLGDLSAARMEYERATALCPELRNAVERLAAIALRENDCGRALECYERIADMDPGNLDALLTLGALYLAAREPEAAIDQFQQALLIEPEACDEFAPAAEALVQDGQIDDAIRNLEELVQRYPSVAPYRVQLGDLYVRAGDDERALAEYSSALATQPDFLEATVKLGTQHMRSGRYIDAALTFNRAVELNDRLIVAFAGLGIAQHSSGRERESRATLDLAASLEPSSTLLFTESLRLQLQSKRDSADRTPAYGADTQPDSETHSALLTEALRRHQQALATSPNHADLHYRYGLLLRQLGRHRESVNAFRNAIRINPNYTKALIKLGICLKEMEQDEEAIQVFQRALELDNSYVDVHYQLGLLFAQRNQFDLATEEFELALAGHSGTDPSFRANLVLALQNIGMVDKASAMWQSICELTPEHDELLARREDYLRQANES